MLDTDTCIFLMRRASAQLESRARAVPLADQVMSAVTFAELTFGVHASAAARREDNAAVLSRFVRALEVLHWPAEAAQHYAEIRGALKTRGAQLGAADLMIAAHARCIGATVVTNNTKDFERVPELAIQNWM